jgi:four helix bundle protein
MKHNFKNLIVWQKARELNKSLYEITAMFPESERFGIVNQIRRASISVMSNIAEGSGRRSEKDFNHFLDYAYASSLELESLIIASADLDFINNSTSSELSTRLIEIQKMIYGLKLKNA